MRTHFTIGIFAAVLALSGCSGDPKSEVHDVSYFMEKDEPREAMIERCDNNPGLYENDPNCINAQEAKRKKSIEDTVKAAEEKYKN